MSNKLLLPQGFLDFFHFYVWQESLKYCTYWRQEHFTYNSSIRTENITSYYCCYSNPPQNLGSYQSGIWDLRLTMSLLTSKYIYWAQRGRRGIDTHSIDCCTNTNWKHLSYITSLFLFPSVTFHNKQCGVFALPFSYKYTHTHVGSWCSSEMNGVDPSLSNLTIFQCPPSFPCAAQRLQVECVNRTKDQLLSGELIPLERPS